MYQKGNAWSALQNLTPHTSPHAFLIEVVCNTNFNIHMSVHRNIIPSYS